MPKKLETHTNWEAADRRLHDENELPAREARQGRLGRRVLAILVMALVLTAIAWALADMWGSKEIPQTPPLTTQDQTSTAKPLPTPAVQGDSQSR